MINNWKDLEKWVLDLFSFDNSMIPANSGGTKKEEDVVSENLVAQCKYSDQKNINILDKDLKRLQSSAELLDKIPVFFTKSDRKLVISFVINHDSENDIRDMIKILAINKKLQKLFYKKIDNKKSLDIAYKELDKLNFHLNKLKSKLKQKINTIKAKLQTATDNILSYNLFETYGDKNGAK